MESSSWRDNLEMVIRSDDGERIGYLRPESDDRHSPLNLLGIPVGAPAHREEATDAVKTHAMASLINPWWCRATRPLTEPIVDARTVGEDGQWDRMVVAELTPDRALMRPMYAWPEESGCYLAVDLPAVDILFTNEPVDAI
ncbi:MAG TPA: hypothetical protein VNZ58_03435 [Thermomicrobiales bacterium]|nr:hypothetical protein [Thermomicrobiales bacterium]